MIFLWPQKLHIVILYTPTDNIWRPDESETKNGKPAHPTVGALSLDMGEGYNLQLEGF